MTISIMMKETFLRVCPLNIFSKALYESLPCIVLIDGIDGLKKQAAH